MQSIEGLDYREWTEPSDSRIGVEHHVRLWLRDFRGFKEGTLSCDCEGWIYSRKSLAEKECRHTRRVQARLERSEIISSVRGSEVMFNEEVVIQRVKAAFPTNDDFTTARVRALAKALQEV